MLVDEYIMIMNRYIMIIGYKVILTVSRRERKYHRIGEGRNKRKGDQTLQEERLPSIKERKLFRLMTRVVTPELAHTH